MIDLATSNDPFILGLLARHPGVTARSEGEKFLEFQEGDAVREVRQGDRSAPVFGLVELIDNNPLVCAQAASIPSPAATLAFIALGPILLAGASLRPPILQLNLPADPNGLLSELATLAPIDQIRLITPNEDATVATFIEAGIFGKGVESRGLLAAQAAVDLPPSFDLAKAVSVFDERFGRSLYVRRNVAPGYFKPDELVGRPFASYRVGTTKGSSATRVLVEVAADPRGKPGAAGAVHAMNVMAGFEESLGLDS